MHERKQKIYAADFETTVYKGQQYTEVWAAACVEIESDDVKIFCSIEEQFNFFNSGEDNILAYYHNLKFDGEFWMSYLLRTQQYKQALDDDNNFLPIKRMPKRSISYSISEMGQWYRLIIRTDKKIIELRDSLKLLPFTLRRIGESFKTEHKKLEMEYTGFRYAGCEITEEERAYIANDVLVLKEALEITFEAGHKKLTIGSCCLSEYKQIEGREYERLYPDLASFTIPEEYGASNADAYIRKGYRGGWCYLARGKEGIHYNGATYDVNSLYPSMMSSESMNRFPVGLPTFWRGVVPDEARENGRYYYLRVRCGFKIKDGKLPFIQTKNTLLYKINQMLETSDIWDKKTQKYYSEYVNSDGQIVPVTMVLTLSCVDWKLMQEHYNIYGLEYLDGCYFETRIGVFDDYIDKYRKEKMENKGAKRELAKLFLNNLYGKMATNTNSSYKIARVKEDGCIGYSVVPAYDKKPGYIAVGAAITSYARNFTIRAAQANYYGPDEPGFIYADTDSIHLDLPSDKVRGITEHDKNFCCWKKESEWDIGKFVRQKTYVEHTSDGYEIKCAGMPQRCKELFIASMGEDGIEPKSEEEAAFLATRRTLDDFGNGLMVPGKLVPKRIIGGVILSETTYEIR